MEKKKPKQQNQKNQPSHNTKTTWNTPFQQDHDRQDVGFSSSVVSLSQLSNSPDQWFQYLMIQPCWVAGTPANDLKKTLRYMLCQNIQTVFNCSIWDTG